MRQRMASVLLVLSGSLSPIFLAITPVPAFAQSSDHPTITPKPAKRLKPFTAHPSEIKRPVFQRKLTQAAQKAREKASCPSNCDALRAKVREQGTVAVLVDFKFSDTLGLDRATEHARIVQMQDRILSRMEKHKLKHIRRSQVSAGMSMTVDATALEALIVDPDIESIEENTTEGLFLSESGPLIGGNQMWTNGFTGSGYTVRLLIPELMLVIRFWQERSLQRRVFPKTNLVLIPSKVLGLPLP